METISTAWMVQTFVGALIVMVGFFLSRQVKKLDRIDFLQSEWKMFMKDLGFHEKRIDAAFKKIDALEKQLRGKNEG